MGESIRIDSVWRIENQRGSIRPWSRRPVASNVHGAKPCPRLFSVSFCGSTCSHGSINLASHKL